MLSLDVAGKSICGYRCKYRAEAYHDDLFEKLGIKYPPQLNRAVNKRRSEYLAGRFCAQQSLSLLGRKTPRLDIPSGKNREPIWPEGIIASIAHSANTAICVATDVADVIGLGVDIENEMLSDIADMVSQRIVLEEEERLIRSRFPAYNQGLTVLFSAKESAFKAMHRSIGRIFDFTALRGVVIDEEKVVFSVVEPLSDDFGFGIEIPVNFEIIDSEILTLCCLTRS